MTFLCYPRCSTCRKARQFLEDNGVVFDERHIVVQNPTKAELAEWYTRSGLPLKKLFNTSGLQYKALQLKDRLPGMTEDEMLSLLATDGMLVKRPILLGDNFVLVGFREEQWRDALHLN